MDSETSLSEVDRPGGSFAGMWEEGAEDFRRGVPIWENPYVPESGLTVPEIALNEQASRAFAWQRGWWNANAENGSGRTSDRRRSLSRPSITAS